MSTLVRLIHLNRQVELAQEEVDDIEAELEERRYEILAALESAKRAFREYEEANPHLTQEWF